MGHALPNTCFTAFFFRPSPLRLSPGRHTVFVLVNELANCMKQHPSLGRQKRSVDHYAVRCLVRPISEKQHKQNKPKNKQNTRRNRHRSKDSSVGAGNLCANELRDLAKQQKNTTEHHGKIVRRCPKQSTQQRRNPGSPLPGSRRLH